MSKNRPPMAIMGYRIRKTGLGHTKMRILLSSLFTKLRVAVIFLTLGCFGFPVQADDYDKIIVLNHYAHTDAVSDSGTIDQLSGSLEMALTDLGITPIDPRFSISPNLGHGEITPEMLKALKQYEGDHAGRLLMIEVSTVIDIATPESIVPRVSIIDVGSGAIIAVVTTLPILPPFDLPGIDAGAAALARSIAKRLDDGRYRVGPGNIKPWGGPARSVRIALEGFDACDQRALLTTMEEEFPGFLGLELEKAPNPTYAIYRYETTATKERLKKWVQLLIAENGAQQADVVRLYVQRDDFRLQKIKGVTLFRSLCGN